MASWAPGRSSRSAKTTEQSVLEEEFGHGVVDS